MDTLDEADYEVIDILDSDDETEVIDLLDDSDNEDAERKFIRESTFFDRELSFSRS